MEAVSSLTLIFQIIDPALRKLIHRHSPPKHNARLSNRYPICKKEESRALGAMPGNKSKTCANIARRKNII
jgi:molybdopterin biosynthesis enzyme